MYCSTLAPKHYCSGTHPCWHQLPVAVRVAVTLTQGSAKWQSTKGTSSVLGMSWVVTAGYTNKCPKYTRKTWSLLVRGSRVQDFQDKTHNYISVREGKGGFRTTSALFLQGLMVFSRHYMAIISNFHFHVIILVLACTDTSYSGYYV